MVLDFSGGRKSAGPLTTLYGWDGSGEKTLEATGAKYALTRERIRQISTKFQKRLLESRALRHAQFPVLDRVISYITTNLPAEADNLELSLLEQGLTTSRFDLSGVVAAVRILREDAPFMVVPHGKKRFVVAPGDAAFPGAILKVAGKTVSSYGIANIGDVLSRIEKETVSVLACDAAASVLAMRDDFRWLDKQRGWFWFTSISRNPLLHAIRKILCVGNSVDVAEIRAGIGRAFRDKGFAPPRTVLLALCSQLDWCKVDGRTVHADPPLDWDKELKGSAEWGTCAILKQCAPLVSTEELERECLDLGMTRSSLWRCIRNSPVIVRYATGLYGLVGAEFPLGLVDELLAQSRRVSRSPKDYGWTGEGKVWLVRRITKSTLHMSCIYLPAGLRQLLQGEHALKSADGTPFGRVTAKDQYVWGIRGFLVRRSAEPGDYVGLVFSMASREAKIYLGDEGLISELSESSAEEGNP